MNVNLLQEEDGKCVELREPSKDKQHRQEQEEHWRATTCVSVITQQQSSRELTKEPISNKRDDSHAVQVIPIHTEWGERVRTLQNGIKNQPQHSHCYEVYCSTQSIDLVETLHRQYILSHMLVTRLSHACLITLTGLGEAGSDWTLYRNKNAMQSHNHQATSD